MNEVNYNHERGLKHELINNEPSPEFLSSSQLTKKFNPLTVREGNCFTDKVYSLFTTHHSLKKAAFTLAEVLVTLGIIGVVSAMTVPTLMQNYQRQSYVTQLHKVYNELSQALLRYQTDKNAINLTEAGLTTQAAVNDFVNAYFKVVKTCEANNSSCFAASYKKVNGTALNSISTAYTAILASGQTIAINPRNDNADMVLRVLVDVNGLKGPNIQGRDLFEMFVYNTGDGFIIDDYGSAPLPLTEAHRNTHFNTYCIAGGRGNMHGCFGKILNDNWQMMY